MIDFFEINMKILQFNIFTILGLIVIISANAFFKGLNGSDKTI